MNKNRVTKKDTIAKSSLYSEDLAPIPGAKRNWNQWHLAAIWVGMAVCIPTYLLASYMIKTGLNWYEALMIIGIANLLITIPMVINGHAGVKYGLPFPVIGRTAFGIKGVHLASVTRGIIACGWFGIQTWVGGLAVYAIFNALAGVEGTVGLSVGKFVGFGVFWLINMYFIWKGTDSIKWLETYSAPILILMGIVLIGWGYTKAGGFGIVLEQSDQLKKVAATVSTEGAEQILTLQVLHNKEGEPKANQYKMIHANGETEWTNIPRNGEVNITNFIVEKKATTISDISIQFRNTTGDKISLSSVVKASPASLPGKKESKVWKYIVWLTAMVGFWATMAISIADITRYATSQKAQVSGQFMGLPGTMMLYSFVGIFVTCAALLNFEDILIAEDAPWDPVSLLAKFKNPWVVVVAQVFMLIATLSTNIAANVIAPANAFSNMIPNKINFRTGGMITGILGIVIAPWWLLDEISGVLIFVSGLLGPVLGISIADYFLVRKKELNLEELYKEKGKYFYSRGFNKEAMIALFVGVFVALVGYWVPQLHFLYALSWFSGFATSLLLYYLLMKKPAIPLEGNDTTN
ncbi:NCS1 family nucleobase:cation symporter-1 [Aquimarina sediminis]|uniref:NCS1 family nucleobase:cation symporter-1 n=1 Tax=Aquimarina sediminis TaxID=2070536 RepID=UPI000CA0523E|nr:NCS1 family nucleobase:cation symporter-1 [Aquimarina sediminis]